MPAHLTDSASRACHSASLCLCALLEKYWLSTPLIFLSACAPLSGPRLGELALRAPKGQPRRGSALGGPARLRTKQMSTPPWEVLSQYATRHRIPKRRPDGRFKDASELADDIFQQEQRMQVLSNGCFFIEKRFGRVTERTAPLTEYPRRHRKPPAGSEPTA